MVFISTENLVLNIAQGMKNPLDVKKTMLDPASANPNSFISSLSWDDLSLVSGYPTLLLFFSVLREKNLLDNEEILHHLVLRIKEALEREGIADLSLYNGLSGVLFALQQASLDGKRYRRMLAMLNSILITRTKYCYLQPILENVRQNRPTPSHLYDLISGISGIGRYALENISQPEFYKFAEDITKVLIQFCNPLSIKDKKVPGWLLLNSSQNHFYPYTYNGHFNLGLAHGITGVLAYLSIALLKGIEVVGHKEAIRRIIEWLFSKSYIRNSAVQWPEIIFFEEEIQDESFKNVCSRNAWCSGVPGIARTLFLTGKALKDNELKTFALRVFRGIFQRPKNEWGIISPNLCHGVSGLLKITAEMVKEDNCEDLIPKISELQNALLSYYQPDAIFGFKDIELCPDNTYAELNKICLLEGSIGILLTLLTLSDSRSQWQLPLMIHD